MQSQMGWGYALFSERGGGRSLARRSAAKPGRLAGQRADYARASQPWRCKVKWDGAMPFSASAVGDEAWHGVAQRSRADWPVKGRTTPGQASRGDAKSNGMGLCPFQRARWGTKPGTA